MEVEGFTYNSQTWTSDPLDSDSNGDGMNDGEEWNPNLTGDDFVNFNDYDHDGVPNLWDGDNDGDGVPDGNDLSPFAVEPYRDQFQLTISGPQTGNALYIDIQMRPITDHLRYSLTTLDWPSDSLGQIQDLNDSTDDMQLFPVLEVQSQISPTLSQEYGINVTDLCTSGSNTSTCYSMWVPLQTNEFNRQDLRLLRAHCANRGRGAERHLQLAAAGQWQDLLADAGCAGPGGDKLPDRRRELHL